MPTSKKILIITLSLMILGNGVFLFVHLANRSSDDSYFHQKVKPKIIRVDWLRNFFRLHDAGDARFDFLHTPESIEVALTTMEGIPIDYGMAQEFTESITRNTGKAAFYSISHKTLSYASQISDNDLDTMLARSRKKTTAQTLSLYFLSHNATTPSLFGLTYRDHGIVLYATTISEFNGNNPSAISDYLLSTALHEFGHQIGLEHNDQPNCFMNEHVEVGVAASRGHNTPTDFCAFEKEQIKKITNSATSR